MSEKLHNKETSVKESNTEVVKFLLQPSIIIAMITALLFLITAAYKVGLYSYYKIPIYLIKIDIKDVVPMIVLEILYGIVLFVLVKLFNFFKLYSKKKITIVRAISYSILFVSIILLIIAIKKDIRLLYSITLLTISITFLFIIFFGLLFRITKEVNEVKHIVTIDKLKNSFIFLIFTIAFIIILISFFKPIITNINGKLSICENSYDPDYNAYILVDGIDDKYIVVKANVIDKDTLKIYRGVFTEINSKDVVFYNYTFKRSKLLNDVKLPRGILDQLN